MRCLGLVPRAKKGVLPRALAVQGSSEGKQVTLLMRVLPPWLGSPTPVVSCYLIQLEGFARPFWVSGSQKYAIICGKQVDLSAYFVGPVSM